MEPPDELDVRATLDGLQCVVRGTPSSPEARARRVRTTFAALLAGSIAIAMLGAVAGTWALFVGLALFGPAVMVLVDSARGEGPEIELPVALDHDSLTVGVRPPRQLALADLRSVQVDGDALRVVDRRGREVALIHASGVGPDARRWLAARIEEGIARSAERSRLPREAASELDELDRLRRRPRQREDR